MDFETLPTVVAIVGSRRGFTKKHWIEAFVSKLKPGSVVVSGGAIGVDSWAKEYTDQREDLYYKPLHIEHWEWTILGKSVGFARNELLVRWVKRYGGVVVIFAKLKDGELEGGSKDVKDWCEKLDVELYVYGQ